MKNNKSFKGEKVFIQHTKKCECGHSLTIRNKRYKSTCKWCGRLVFLHDRDEFKYIMMNRLREVS